MAALAYADDVEILAENGSETQSTKLLDMMKAWARDHEEPFISFEYYAPRTEAGKLNLLKRFERMAKQDPLFMDVTWGAGGSTSELTMELCEHIKNQCGRVPNMHLTCTNMDEGMVERALEKAVENGFTNILALRGDAPAGADHWEARKGGFYCARDLVAHISKHHPGQFCITVAGYPQGHPDRIKLVDRPLTADEETRATYVEDKVFVCSDEEYQIELKYLKSKVDAGAEIITTQMFFEAELFVKFVKDCRAIGITAPIIPGIMLLQTYHGFKRMIDMCKSRVPASWLAELEAVKDNEADVVQLGIRLGSALCEDLIAKNSEEPRDAQTSLPIVPGLHIYTLNLETVTDGILKSLGRFKTA